MYKLVVAGGRDFTDYQLACEVLDLYVPQLIVAKGTAIEIVQGGARGADRLGERWAKDNDFWHTCFPADWDTNGKRAGPIRNDQMGRYARGNGLIAFHDGKSRGTANMIKTAKKYNFDFIKVVLYEYGGAM